MSDFLATALGLAFTLLVCLMALHAILSPMLRGPGNQKPNAATPPRTSSSPERETTPVHS